MIIKILIATVILFTTWIAIKGYLAEKKREQDKPRDKNGDPYG